MFSVSKRVLRTTFKNNKKNSYNTINAKSIDDFLANCLLIQRLEAMKLKTGIKILKVTQGLNFKFRFFHFPRYH